MIKKNLENLNKILKSGKFDLEKFSSEIKNIENSIFSLSDEDKKSLLQELNNLLKNIEYKQSLIQNNINKLKQKLQVEAKYYGRKKTY